MPKPSLSSRVIALATTTALHLLLLLLLVSGHLLRGANRPAAGSSGELVIEASITPEHPRPAQHAPVTHAAAAQQTPSSVPSPSRAIEKPAQNESANPGRPEIASRSDEGFRIGSVTGETNFERRLLTHIARFRHYPDRAKQERLSGEVRVTFTMDRAGNVLAIAITGPSGSPLLDTEAVNTVLRAQPLPAIPSDLPDTLEVELPVSFDASQLGTVAVAQ